MWTPPRPPRLIARRPLSYPVSLMLALLRKRLAEADAGGGDARLVLSREEIAELMRVFLPDGTNERASSTKWIRPSPRWWNWAICASSSPLPAQLSGHLATRCGASSRRSSMHSGWPTSMRAWRISHRIVRCRSRQGSWPMNDFSPQELDFLADDSRVGFRLQRLEVLNWGTFDRRVWRYELNGRNGLLTGDIGSGKSTLVDAVTTLLVPRPATHRLQQGRGRRDA